MIAGLGMAAKLVSKNLSSYAEHMKEQRNLLLQKLQVRLTMKYEWRKASRKLSLIRFILSFRKRNVAYWQTLI